MKQNWWKLVVVAVLVIAVGVVLAAKNKAPESGAEVASTPSVSTAIEAVEPADEQDTALETAETKPVENATTAAPGTPAETPVATPTKPEPKVVTNKAPEQPKKATNTAPAEPVTPSPGKLPKLLELGADKCVPCKMMKPIIDDLEKNYKGKLDVEFIDVWKDESAAGKYGIKTIPTQIFYDENGKEFFRHQGFFSKEEILQKFEEQGIKF